MTVDHDAWLSATEKLTLFTPKRCVQLQHEDWRELSSVLALISRVCESTETAAPVFIYALELLLRLGQVTSCLLSLNGDDPGFSVARIAQAIRATTQVLETCLRTAPGAGLSEEIADGLARQRCEQTPLLHAMAWALRQEARALFFNPRPTALSLATALLDLFRAISKIWPDDIFAPLYHSPLAATADGAATAQGDTAATVPAAPPHRLVAAAADPSAARLADPAAQLAMAMLRCAGRAVAEIGAAASKQIMLSGLRVADDLMRQISSLIDKLELPADEPHLKQLLQSPSILQLMLTMLAIQTQRLQQHLGLRDEDSFTLQHPAKRPEPSEEPADDDGDSGSSGDGSSCDGSPAVCGTGSGGNGQQEQDQQQQEHEHDDDSDDVDHDDAAGNLHQLWNEVLGMAKRQAAVQPDQQQQREQPEQPKTPLLQLWESLGLPESMLSLAACEHGVFTGTPEEEYITACKVARFLLQGSSHLQPSKETPAAATAAAAAAGPGHSSCTAGSAAAAVAAAAAAAAARDMSPTTSPRQQQQLLLERAMSPTATAAALLVESCRDYGLRGQEEMEVLRLQRLLPVMLLDTAASLKGLGSSSGGSTVQGQYGSAVLSSSASISSWSIPTTTAAAAAAGDVAGQHQQQHPEQQQEPSSSSSSSNGRGSSLSLVIDFVWAATGAAACSARCWPVLHKVAAVSSSSQWPTSMAGNAPAGAFAGLSSVFWKEYDIPNDSQLPLQELLQLVVQVTQLLLLPQQQQQPAAAAASDPETANAAESVGATGEAEATARAKHTPAGEQGSGSSHQQGVAAQPPSTHEPMAAASSSSSSNMVLKVTNPHAREALSALLEVLTAVSKLPWEPEAAPNSSRSSSRCLSRSRSRMLPTNSLADMRNITEAWRVMCQPVAAAVEACLRAAGAASASWQPPEAAPAAAARQPRLFLQRIGLSSCLAALCAPIGRPGPLVAAIGAVGGRGPQLQLFALVISKVKLLLFDQSQRKELIAMHPIEQTPVYFLGQLQKQQAAAAAGAAVDRTEAGVGGNELLQNPTAAAAASPAAAAAASPAATAAAAPWLLLLGRLILMRGKLLGELLQRDASDASSEARATSTLHNAFWHVQMAEVSAIMLDQYLASLCSSSNSSSGCCIVHQQPEQDKSDAAAAAAAIVCDLQQCQQPLHCDLLPALKHAVQLCKAAIKLARHYHETGFASGFAAGFAAGYAAAAAAAAGSGAGGGLAASISFASPWGVLQQGCIRDLPQQMQTFGAALCSQMLLPYCCNNPACVNLRACSELQLVAERVGGAVVCGKCGMARYCSLECRAAHRSRHKHLCKKLAAGGAAAAAGGSAHT